MRAPIEGEGEAVASAGHARVAGGPPPGRWHGGRQVGRGADAGRRQQGQAEAGAARGQRGRVATHGRGATASERVCVRSTATATTGREGEARGCSRRGVGFGAAGSAEVGEVRRGRG